MISLRILEKLSKVKYKKYKHFILAIKMKKYIKIYKNLNIG